MINRCDLLKQYSRYKNEINQSILNVLESGNYILGPSTQKFEQEFCHYIGSNFSIGVANGTDALILSLKSLGITSGDEVITTPFTAIPTVSAIIACGANPVFVDIDPNTFLIDFKEVLKKVSPKTKAIVGVHIFGNVFNVKELFKILDHKIPIIEDACQAHGSEIDGVKTGKMGTLAAFSFYPTKNLGAYGDGGLVTTNNQELHDKIKLLRQYGMENRDKIVINGINSRLDDMQAAILSVKLPYLDQMNEARNHIANLYYEHLDTRFVKFQQIDKNVKTNFHVFSILVKNDRDELVKHLDDQKIQTTIFYKTPIPYQPANAYLGYKKGDLPNTELVCSNIISIPMYPEMSHEEVKLVVKSINQFWK